MRRAWIEIQSWWSLLAHRKMSPSVRRAWIEIVVLHRDGHILGSPSVRRAWIEILFIHWEVRQVKVALREEGVD